MSTTPATDRSLSHKHRLMVLKHIETCDFRNSEQTNYLLLLKASPHLRALKSNEVVLLRSRSGDQLVFTNGFKYVGGGASGMLMYLESVRLRLEKGSWSPLMIANYARQVGIILQGIKTLEEHIESVEAAVLARLGALKQAKTGKK